MAQKLRKQGKSVNDIVDILNKPKSTIAYWCRDVQLTKKQMENLLNKSKHAGREVFIKNAKKKKEKHKKLLNHHHDIGIENIDKLSKRDLDMLCIGLYWGEGYKTGNGEFGFTNSDASMIKVYLKWLYEVHSVSKDRIILRISINQIHKNRASDVMKFWQAVTSLPEKQFTKTSFIKSESKKVYSNHNEHMGTLRVKVSRGANIRAEILGSIQKIC